MSNYSKAETYLAKERCVCGHKRIAHIHYKRDFGLPEIEPSYCGYPDYDGDGKSIYCPCQKYEKADVSDLSAFYVNSV